VLRDLKARDVSAPKLVTGDGALGAWAALRDVFGAARRQACWVHTIRNVLDCLPKRLQPKARELLGEIMNAPTKTDAKRALERFRAAYDAKYPKAPQKLDRGWEHLTAFYQFPAEHWRHIRTSNVIESPFATVRLRTKVTKGAGSKKAALMMAFKLLQSAENGWHRINGYELLDQVIAGTEFKDGIRVPERHPETQNEKVAA
jgi:putative transposase